MAVSNIAMEDGVVSMNSLRGHAARSEIGSSLGIGDGVADQHTLAYCPDRE
jgi:hypothetical protein